MLLTCHRVFANTYLHSNWVAKKADEVALTGNEISTASYDASTWMEAIVPGTVLTMLVANGIYPDPYYGMNNQDIPDIYNAGIDFYTYWFRTTFELSDSLQDKKIWLNFRGINYTAEIYLNGETINSGYKGMFLRQNFDVTSVVDFSNPNYLAVKITPPDHPGSPDGSNGGDGVIGRDVTMQYTIGWDWVRPVRDRNAGIWDHVSIYNTGPVILMNPSVVTDLPLPDTGYADLTISVQVRNSESTQQSGKVIAEIDDISFEQPVQLNPNETKEIVLNTSNFSQLHIQQPRLWWPNGYGEQALYDLKLTFRMDDETISDTSSLRFGIREFSYEYDPELVVKVNDQKIFCTGGNWVSTDAMLRFSEQRYDDEIRLHKEANLTMIRVWGGGITERPEFYDACDKYGILVMQDFWMTGDCNGRYGGSPSYPDDHALFLECAEDAIKMLQNHPSLCIWTGGNEVVPPSDINSALDSLISNLDGTRIYIPSSDDFGLHGHGPYEYKQPEFYFDTTSHGFTTEIGTYAFPPVESMRDMMDESDLWPINLDAWEYHFFSFRGSYSEFNTDVYSYGTPQSIDDHCFQAQLVNYCTHKAMFEAWNKKMWDDCSGILCWKSQGCWPCLIWQFYDWYLEPHAGYYGIKSASEPLHIQMNLDDYSVYIINHNLHSFNQLKAVARVYYVDGQLVESLTDSLSQIQINANTIEPCFNIPFTDDSTFYFIKLQLKDAADNVLSENFYWRGNRNQLEQLPDVDLDITTIEESEDENGNYKLTYSIENPSAFPAFFIRLKIFKELANERVLPVFYSDNYFTILPNEAKEISLEFAQDKLTGELPVLMVEGYNVISKTVGLITQPDTSAAQKVLTAYPNPFNNLLSINFTVNTRAITHLKIYNILGQELVDILDQELDPGPYQRSWNAEGASSGVYIVKLAVDDKIHTSKVILIK